MTSGPAKGRRKRALILRGLSACPLLMAVTLTDASAQTLTNDLLRPVQGGFVSPQDLPLRRTEPAPDGAGGGNSIRTGLIDSPAPSRIGRTPVYGTPAASGAADSGFDSLNRKRKRAKVYPGAPKPRVPPGPGSAIPIVPTPPLTIPPSSTANRPPIAPALAGTVAGQPARKRLRPDDDPFGAVGDYAGSFLVKSALEVSGGYDSNPARVETAKGSAFYVVAPELLVVSDWERHAFVADLRGSYTGYGTTFPPSTVPCDCNGGLPAVSSVPTSINRPEFTGHVDGRIDVTHDTRILSELRLRVSTDNPGSPNIQAGLSKYPLFATTGASAGLDQNFNRLQITGVGNIDRTVYQNSVLTDGTSTTNDDRNFNQYGWVARASYELLPGVKPFGEVEANTRVHDVTFDRSGYRRDSTGGSVKAGTSFEFTRLLTGDISVGYTARTYDDPRLNKLTGLLTSASLVWSVSGLTTARLIANTSVDETTLPAVSGVLTRSYTAQVDHDFRRWLTGIGRFTYGTLDYQGSTRSDRLYSLSADLVYKLSRSFWVKAQVRQDRLDSSAPGFSTVANVVMLGVRVQN